jgi:hypothetical protein
METKWSLASINQELQTRFDWACTCGIMNKFIIRLHLYEYGEFYLLCLTCKKYKYDNDNMIIKTYYVCYLTEAPNCS